MTKKKENIAQIKTTIKEKRVVDFTTYDNMGEFVLIMGTMNTYKSLELIKDYEKAKKYNRLIISPADDNRYGVGKVTTKFGSNDKDPPISVPAVVMESICADEIIKKHPGIQKIYIDEVQFFPVESVMEILKLVYRYKIDVRCYGLRLDYTGKMWDTTNELLRLGAHPQVMYAPCANEQCNNDATMDAYYEKGIPKIDGIQKIIGTDSFSQLCTPCWLIAHGKIR